MARKQGIGPCKALNRSGFGPTGRGIFGAVHSWAYARGARSSPGFHITGFQPHSRRDPFQGLAALAPPGFRMVLPSIGTSLTSF